MKLPQIQLITESEFVALLKGRMVCVYTEVHVPITVTAKEAKLFVKRMIASAVELPNSCAFPRVTWCRDLVCLGGNPEFVGPREFPWDSAEIRPDGSL